jgi:hypothetical protein
LRNFAKRVAAEHSAEIDEAPRSLPPPGPQIGPQSREQVRYRKAAHKSMDRRRRHFDGLNARYARGSASRRLS